MLIAILGLIFGLIAYVFFVLSLQKALKQCSEEYRTISPGLVWLIMVPVVNFFANFFVIIKMSQSLDSEFKARGIDEDTTTTMWIGIAYSILTVTAIFSAITVISQLLSLVCLIVYWLKINSYTKLLSTRNRRMESFQTV